MTLHFQRLAVQLRYLETIPSTNTYLKKLASEGAEEGTCLIADEQTAGRGRYDRSWISPRGEGLYLSILLRPKITIEHLPLLSLLGAVAVAQALRHLTGSFDFAKTDIKWPNDVLLNGKKVCGILAESVFSKTFNSPLSTPNCSVVLGVGVNLHQQSFPDGLIYPPTSLLLELGERLPRETVVEEFLSALDEHYAALEREPRSIIATWSELSSFAHGKQVQINTGTDIIEGITRGLRQDGALCVERSDGLIEEVMTGDVLRIEN